MLMYKNCGHRIHMWLQYAPSVCPLSMPPSVCPLSMTINERFIQFVPCHVNFKGFQLKSMITVVVFHFPIVRRNIRIMLRSCFIKSDLHVSVLYEMFRMILFSDKATKITVFAALTHNWSNLYLPPPYFR